MATNDFITFATDPGANVDSQAVFLTRSNNTGFGAGSVATSSWVNKAIRQASLITHMITQFIVDKTGQNAVDDGTTATLEANFISAILASIPASGVLSFNGRGGVVSLTSGDVTSALGAVPIFVNGTATGDLTGLWPGPTIKSGAVTNAKMANMGGLTFKMNNTGAPAAPQDVAIADVLTAFGFDFSHIGAKGHVIFPGGFMFQWDTVSPGDDASATYNFDVPFTNQVMGAVATVRFNGAPPKTGGNGGGAYCQPTGLSTIIVGIAWNGDATGITTATYFAWGI